MKISIKSPGTAAHGLSYSSGMVIFILVLLLLMSASCSTPPAVPDQNNPPDSVEFYAETDIPAVTDQPPPPTPSVPVVLITGEETMIADDFQVLLVNSLASEGFEAVFLSSLTEDDLRDNTAYILSSSSSAVQLDETRPNLPLLILDPSDPSRGTREVLAFSDSYYQQAAFLAGYISALFTPDYRTAYIDLAGSEIEGVYRSFSSGATYFCGLCSPQYPPFADYPIYVQISEPFTQEKISAVIEAMLAESVSTAYLHPHLHSQDLITSLKDAGIASISNQGPILQSDHNADLILGPDFNSLVPQLVSALVNKSIPEPVTPLPAVLANHDTLSPGRLQHLGEIIQMLGSGSILPAD